jgi:hypothetical protein
MVFVGRGRSAFVGTMAIGKYGKFGRYLILEPEAQHCASAAADRGSRFVRSFSAGGSRFKFLNLSYSQGKRRASGKSALLYCGAWYLSCDRVSSRP